MGWRLALCVLAATCLFSGVTSSSYIPADFPENIENEEGWKNRIVSGWEARPGQHPHQVSLRMVDVTGLVGGCGGNVVSRQWIISAAHCTATRVTIVVRAGVVWLTRPEFMLETTEYYNYPTWDASRPGVVQPDDISLVKLPRPLEYSRNLQPIRIQPSAEAHRNYDELIVHASGFGRTWTDGPTTEVLNWVFLRGVSNAACASVFGSQLITPNTMCARYFNVTSQSVCQGDSGGPLVHVEEGVATLVGISSFVAGQPFGCHSGLPAGFIRPGPFHSWYTEVTGIDFENLNEDEPTTTPLPTTVTTASPTTQTTDSPTTQTTTTVTQPTTVTQSTTVTQPTTVTEPSTTEPSTTTTTTTTTTPAPGEDDSEEEDDPELSELLKKLEVQVKVLVRLTKRGRNNTDVQS